MFMEYIGDAPLPRGKPVVMLHAGLYAERFFSIPSIEDHLRSASRRV